MASKRKNQVGPEPVEQVGDSNEITEKIEEDSAEHTEGAEDEDSDGPRELDILDPEFPNLTLLSGLEVRVERLKMRQLMKLMKILTSGGMLSELFADLDGDFQNRLIAVTLASIPESEEETLEFVASLVFPNDYVQKPATKVQRELNDALIDEMNEEFNNPEIEDVVNILEKMIRLEAPHLESLGKRLASLLPAA